MFKRLPEPNTVIDDLYFEGLSSDKEDTNHDISNLSKAFPNFFSNERFNVLDVGVGRGDYTLELALRFPKWKIKGIDNDEKAMRWADYLSANHPNDNVKFKKLDIFNTLGSYERIHMRYSLHHIDDLPSLFEKTYSLQPKGGLILINDFDPKTLKDQSIFRKARQIRSVLPDKIFMKAFASLGYEHLLPTAVSYHAAHKAMDIVDAMKGKYQLTAYYDDMSIGSHLIEAKRK